MNKRPLSVTLIASLYLGAGIVSLGYHSTEFNPQAPFANDFGWRFLTAILAIVCGVCLWRGGLWARWPALVWMGFHVVKSAFHSLSETLMHLALFAVIAIVLFLPNASAYFRNSRAAAEEKPTAS